MKVIHRTVSPPDDSPHGCEAALARLLPPPLHAGLRAEFPELLRQRRHVFHLAMNEAAAIAAQTGFPQLFLPILALEKAQFLNEWNWRQEALRTQGAARSARRSGRASVMRSNLSLA